MTARKVLKSPRTHPHEIAGVIPYEVWVPVSGYPGYFVSNYGRVCSIDRVVNPSGGKTQTCYGRVLQPGINVSGHRYVFLGRHNRKSVHVLVLTAFMGPCPKGHEGLHFDDDKRAAINDIWRIANFAVYEAEKASRS